MNVLKPNKRTKIATLPATGVDRKTIRRLAMDQTGPEANSPHLGHGSATANSATPGTGNRQRTAIAVRTAPRLHRGQLRLRRNYTSIYQDLVDQFGFTGRYNSVKRFAGRLVQREPEQFDRLEFGPARRPNCS